MVRVGVGVGGGHFGGGLGVDYFVRYQGLWVVDAGLRGEQLVDRVGNGLFDWMG